MCDKLYNKRVFFHIFAAILCFAYLKMDFQNKTGEIHNIKLMKNIGIFEIDVMPYIHVTYIFRIYGYLKMITRVQINHINSTIVDVGALWFKQRRHRR